MMTPDIMNILGKYEGAGRNQLIPLLQDVQEQCGYVSREAVELISQTLSLPSSKVYGVATFYNQFRFKPLGRYLIQVCRGTACHVKGSAKLLEALQAALNIEPGDTTADGLFTLEVVACIGACGLAPVITVGGEFHAKVTPEKVGDILNLYRKKVDADE
jgi:NADH-quinone oxidoreductase E subunit